MRNISIKTAAKWETSIGLLGTFSSPLELIIKIENNESIAIKVKHICISVKTLWGSKEILSANKNDIINPLSDFEYSLDIRYILQKYSPKKKFTAKVTLENNEVFESNKLTVQHLNNILQSLS